MGVSDLLPGWPGGDPGKIRDAAARWRTLSSELASISSTADTSVQAALSGWKGAAQQKFETTWNAFIGTHKKAAEDAEKMAKALDSVADKIDELHHKYEMIAVGLAVALAASVAIGFFTFGIGAAAEDAVATASAIAAVDALLESVGIEISEAVLAEIGGTIADALANRIVQGMIVGFATDLDFQEVPGLVAGEGFSPVDLKELAVSTGAGAAGAGIQGALWRRLLAGAFITGSSAEVNALLHGKTLGLEDLLLSGALGSIGGSLSEANPAEASAMQKLENEIKLASMFKRFYDQDPIAAAQVAAKSENQAIKDAYQLLSKYPNLFQAEINDAETQIGASHTVVAKVFAITAQEKVHITYEGLEKAIDKAKEQIPEFTSESAEEQARTVVEMMKH